MRKWKFLYKWGYTYRCDRNCSFTVRLNSYNGCLELKCLLNTMQNIASVTCESSKCHFDWHTAISIPSTIPFASNHSFSNSGSFPIAGVATAESEVVKEEKWNKVSNIWSNLFKIWNFWLTILCSLINNDLFPYLWVILCYRGFGKGTCIGCVSAV